MLHYGAAVQVPEGIAKLTSGPGFVPQEIEDLTAGRVPERFEDAVQLVESRYHVILI
jgi:hypothetical protein